MTVGSIPLAGTRVPDTTGLRQDFKKQTGRRPYANKGLLAIGPSPLKAVGHDAVAEAEAPHFSTSRCRMHLACQVPADEGHSYLDR